MRLHLAALLCLFCSHWAEAVVTYEAVVVKQLPHSRQDFTQGLEIHDGKLYQSTGGGNSEDDVVTTTQIGEIDFEILGCNDAIATVILDGSDPVMYTAAQLTRPFPCEDSE